MLVVVGLTIYHTPGPHNYSPRDIDRRWSVGSPLANDLQPFGALEFENRSEYVQRLFVDYRTIRDQVLQWYTDTSEKRVKLANRFRRPRDVRVGMRVVYRNPRVRADGGGHRGKTTAFRAAYGGRSRRE